jgi:oligopeptidase A
MAETPAEVLAFLHDLAHKAKPFAESDLTELRAFAKKELGLAELEPWDVGYASEKLRQARYAFSEHEVKQYFPEPRVLEGLFNVVRALYGVDIVADAAPKWDPHAHFFRIDKDGATLGHFYLDLHARETKRGGAWMDSARSRFLTRQGLQTPVAYLVCNFPGPVGNKPATFSHDDVLTLFHECGHGLHHMLTQVDDLAVSGIHGVEWDAVELPSQFIGTRKVTSITEVTGMEGDVITMQDIFLFEKTGVSPVGAVTGRFRATGIRPKCSERLIASGVHLPPEMFEHVKVVGK